MTSPSISSNQPLRIALVGAGLVGQRHAKVLQQLSDAELVAIVDTSDAAVEFAAGAGVDLYNDLDSLLNSITIDGVVIATPTNLHVEQGLACVAKKIPSLIEKPIGVTTQESQNVGGCIRCCRCKYYCRAPSTA